VDGVNPAETAGAVAADDLEAVPSFDALYRREWAGLVGLGWSLTGSWAVAEELAQDAFADAYRRWSEVGRLDRPGAWVRRAVVNRAASSARHRDVERRGHLRLAGRAATEADRPSSDRTGDEGADRVDDPAFWAAVRSLPDRQAACVALHYLEERSVDEIAEIVGCRPATVKVHLHRGRKALAERLAHLVVEPSDRTSDPTAEPTTDPTGEVDR
jgi:RNA polymerase sigma-70 factor (ECF subfamily)